MLTIDHTEFFLLFLLSILNFHLVWELLTFFLIVFLSILVIKKKMIKFTFTNSTQWLLSHHHCYLLPSLQWTLVLKTTLPYSSHSLTFQTDLCPGFLSLVLKQNYLLSDIASIKPHLSIISQRSSLLLTLFMWPRRSLTLCLIHVKFMQ